MTKAANGGFHKLQFYDPGKRGNGYEAIEEL